MLSTVNRFWPSWGLGLCLFLLCFFTLSVSHAETIDVFFDQHSAQAQFAYNEISQSLEQKNFQARPSSLSNMNQMPSDPCIVLCTIGDENAMAHFKSSGAAPAPKPSREAFSIRRISNDSRSTVWVVGAGSAGVMYGGLELAEIIRVEGVEGIRGVDQNPYMAMRGVKFNIPLDVRTPSYTDVCDAAQNNIKEMWNFEFWKEFIDNLARYRYNFISLWSLHPFPSLVQIPEYPDVALDDVKRFMGPWKEFYSLNGIGFDSPEILDNAKTVKKLSIEEKIDFWRKVMRYGKERCVDFYFVTWNIFINGTGGKYGITDDIHNPATRDYFRQSVKRMFLTYPDLKGIGLTTGENMHGASFDEKENWAFQTYAQGVLDAAKEQPGRKITFIHRQHQSGAKDIADQFKPLIDHPDIEFIFSFKYAKAHVFSSTQQAYHHKFIKEIGDLKTIWTLRNDDCYHYRWGSPDYVREFILNIPHDVSRGFYYGSDQYIWGREFLSVEPESPRQLEIVKHWYHWMIWGRLGYNPHLSNERFIQIIQERFPQASGKDLFDAWREASMIYPLTTGFHWGSLDFQWYIEACKSHPGFAKTESGFHDVNRFISLKPHPETGYASIPDYVDCVIEGKEIAGDSPLDISRQIHDRADKALSLLNEMDAGDNKELRLTMGDIRAMAYLGKYYGHKIHGSLETALYRKTRDSKHQQIAVRELTEAAQYWLIYTSTASSQYKNPIWLNRVGVCDWESLSQHVLNDIKIAAEPAE